MAWLGAVIAWAAPQSIVIAIGAPLRVVIVLSAVAVGATLSSRTGLSVQPRGVAHPLLVGICIGLAFGAYMALADGTVFRDQMSRIQAAGIVSVPAWKRMAVLMPLALVDEIDYRLCIVSVLTWCFGAFWRTTSGTKPADTAFWLAIVLAATIYLALHLRFITPEGPVTPIAAVRAIALYVFAGSLWGYLFWRNGLMTAIVAHLSAHVTLQLGLKFMLS